MNTSKLIITDAAFGLFDLLNGELKGKAQGLCGRNLVFCEEKLTLMTERNICSAFGGTFNTEVYSFGNFLRAKDKTEKTLSKEGSSMVIKTVLKDLPLKCFNRTGRDIAPALFEVISQLKSAKITPTDLFNASVSAVGMLSDKLADISTVFSAYEKYLEERELTDQNTALSALPELIQKDEEMPVTDVYIVGYVGFTGQIRNIIRTLLLKAKSVTAILVGGKNGFAFVNETLNSFKKICAEVGVTVQESFVKSEYSVGGEIIKNGTFDPLFKPDKKTERIFYLGARSIFAEAERVAEVIRRKVIGGARYKDFTVIIPDGATYKDALTRNFSRLDVPFFFDAKRKPENFPIITLIYSYIDLFTKGHTLSALSSFFKNPYVAEDKEFTDEFENYLFRYNLCYEKFSKPFTLGANEKDIGEEKVKKFDDFRVYINSLLKEFDVPNLLTLLNAESKTELLAEKLTAVSEAEDAAVLTQTYKKVVDVLNEMRFILKDETASATEFKNVFKSGVSEMEISVIPQYNDAVFVGDFRQASLAKAKYLFAMGLTNAVPAQKEDVALITDADIDALKEIKMLIEPKISVVNKRFREETVLGLSAYSDELYVSCPLADISGSATVKSEILAFFERFFRFSDFPPVNGYLTEKQGLRTFARDCSRFASYRLNDFSVQSGFYGITGGKPYELVLHANKEYKLKLDGKEGVLSAYVDSPTAIETFYNCPFSAFMERTLNVRKRQTGDMDALSVGVLAHEIFANFIKKADVCRSEEDAATIFDEIVNDILKSERYSYFDEGGNAFNLELALRSCKKYCLKLYEWKRSTKFKTDRTDLEVGFGENTPDKKYKYNAVSLLDGKVKIKGKIDRIDNFNDQIRIMDYKTGGKEFDDAKYYMGREIQLFLYSLALPEKKLAGVYYVSANDEFKTKENKFIASGKTLTTDVEVSDEREFIAPKGEVSEEQMDGLRRYVKLISEKAAKYLYDGVIAASPCEKACDYCEYYALCGKPFARRETVKADADFIVSAVSGAENDQNESKETGNE